MPSVLAVLAVTALVTSLAVWRGEETVQPGAAASTTSPSAAAREALSEAPASSSPASSPAPSTSAPPPSTESVDQSEPARPQDVQVVVLNQTRRGGLAGAVADQLRGKGWTVPAVGNFRGVVPATTVYYPAGQEAAAQAAAESLPTSPRIRPRFGNLSTTRLTVVVTDSYPG
jgi:hypothetical protein